MKHQRIQNALSAYLDNELSVSMQKQVEAHLQSCQECTDMLAAFQQNSSRIRGLAHPAPPLKDLVLAQIHEELQNDVSAYLDNELASDRQVSVEAHLDTCDECSDMLAAFQQNRARIKSLEHPAPSSIQAAVMAQIREQGAKTTVETPADTRQQPDIRRWLPDFGRWFLRPVTAGATGFLTLVLIFGALYFYPTAPQYDETIDLYFGLYTEQLEDNPLKSNVVKPIDSTSTVDGDNALTGTVDDAELFLDLYLENVGD